MNEYERHDRSHTGAYNILQDHSGSLIRSMVMNFGNMSFVQEPNVQMLTAAMGARMEGSRIRGAAAAEGSNF
jgi:hypothetical protein